jgi:hypothetical protein
VNKVKIKYEEYMLMVYLIPSILGMTICLKNVGKLFLIEKYALLLLIVRICNQEDIEIFKAKSFKLYRSYHQHRTMIYS